MNNSPALLRSALLVAAAIALTCPAWGQMKVSESDAKHAAIEKPAPVIPATARQLKIGGRVELNVTISESGSVSNVEIATGNPILTSACVAAVKRWKFHPFLSDGKPTQAVASISFEFQQ